MSIGNSAHCYDKVTTACYHGGGGEHKMFLLLPSPEQVRSNMSYYLGTRSCFKTLPLKNESRAGRVPWESLNEIEKHTLKICKQLQTDKS